MLVLLLACDTPTPATPVLHHDRSSLQKVLPLPPELGEVTWGMAPIGTVGLGPTDYRLLIWFPKVAESRRKALLTIPEARPLPEDTLGIPVLGTAQGWDASAFETVQWQGSAWTVDDGVLVELQTR